jgi:hypothetical protein
MNPLNEAAKVRAFGKAVLGFVADGCRLTPAEMVAERAAICEICPNLDAAHDSCRICGCKLSMKRAMPRERCPEGKWEAVT